MTSLRIALIGAGYMGTIYARILSQVPGVDIGAVCDVRLDKARSLAADIGCTGYVGDDIAIACAVPGVRAAVIATSESEHTAPALLALQHGLDLFIEKPLAPSVAECRQIIAAAQDGGRIVMVGHTTRFDPRFVAAHDAVQHGEIGAVVHAFARRNNPSSRLQRLGNRVSVAGFLGVHDYDILLWIVGRPVVKVFARGVRRTLAGMGLDDCIITVLTFDDGTLGVVENAWGVPDVQGRPTNLHFSLRGTKGIIEINALEQGFGIYTADAARFPDMWWRPEVHGQVMGGYRDQMANFVHCVETRDVPWATAEDGLASVRVLEAVQRALAEGREVDVETA